MIAYQYAVRDEINRVVSYAEAVRAKFNSGARADDLLRDAENLAALYDTLMDADVSGSAHVVSPLSCQTSCHARARANSRCCAPRRAARELGQGRRGMPDNDRVGSVGMHDRERYEIGAYMLLIEHDHLAIGRPRRTLREVPT